MMKSKTLTQFLPYFICSIGALFIFYKYLIQISPSVMTQDLMQAFSISGAGLGNLAACFFYAYTIMQIPAGIFLDRFSPKRVAIITVLGCVVGVLLFATAHTFLVAGLARALIGLMAAFSGILYLKLVALCLPVRRFGLMAGLMMTVAMLGGMGGQAPLSLLMSVWDWRMVMVSVGTLGIVLLLLFWLVIPANMPNYSVNHSKESPKKFFLDLLRAMKSRRNWLLSLYVGFAFAPFSAFSGLWGVAFLQQAYHLPKTIAATTTSAIFLGFALGCPVLGWLSDRLGRRIAIMFIGTLLALLSISAVIYLPIFSNTMLTFLLFSFGFWVSSIMLAYAIARESQSILLVGSVIGFMNTIPSIFEAFTEPLIGKILDCSWDHGLVNGVRVFTTHDYHIGFAVLPIYFIIGLFLLFFVGQKR